jgi:hypothetical protein
MSIEAIDLELSRGRRPASNGDPHRVASNRRAIDGKGVRSRKSRQNWQNGRYLLPICYQFSSNYSPPWASGLNVQGQPKISISAKEQPGLGIHYDLGEGHPLLDAACQISTWSPPTGGTADLKEYRLASGIMPRFSSFEAALPPRRASCSLAPETVFVGDPVTVSAQTDHLNPKRQPDIPGPPPAAR